MNVCIHTICLVHAHAAAGGHAFARACKPCRAACRACLHLRCASATATGGLIAWSRRKSLVAKVVRRRVRSSKAAGAPPPPAPSLPGPHGAVPAPQPASAAALPCQHTGVHGSSAMGAGSAWAASASAGAGMIPTGLAAGHTCQPRRSSTAPGSKAAKCRPNGDGGVAVHPGDGAVAAGKVRGYHA